MKILKKSIALSLVASTVGITSAVAGDVNVYSYRQEFLTKPLFAEFEKQTGHKVRVLFAKKGLIEKVKTEGSNTKADIVMTVDISNLNKIKKLGISQKITSAKVNKNVPSTMRDADGFWVGLSQRSRIIYASKDRVDASKIKTYLDLANPEWKGKICMRSGTHKYNLGLVSYMLTRYGQDTTKQWLSGLKQNLARKPKGNDRAQVKAIYEGVCDIAIANDYYYGKMLANKDQKVWADSVNLIFPDQAGNGVHINLAGVALMKYAPHKEAAIELIEFLTSKKAQEIYAKVNNETPVNASVPVSDKVKSWHASIGGTLNIDRTVSISDIAENIRKSIKMINEAGINK